MDVQAACTGFVYALSVANSMIQSGQIKTALVIGAETISDVLDEQDRTTAVLFGDGAGAVVVRASDEPGILACKLHSDGSYWPMSCTATRKFAKDKVMGDPRIKMDDRPCSKPP